METVLLIWILAVCCGLLWVVIKQGNELGNGIEKANDTSLERQILDKIRVAEGNILERIRLLEVEVLAKLRTIERKASEPVALTEPKVCEGCNKCKFDSDLLVKQTETENKAMQEAISALEARLGRGNKTEIAAAVNEVLERVHVDGKGLKDETK